MHVPVNTSMTLENTIASARNFLAWWRGELLALVPASWPNLGRNLFLQRLLMVDGDEWRLGFQDRSEEWITLNISEADSDLRDRIARLDPTAQQQRITVVLPSREAIVRSMHLPAAAAPKLRQVVGFQIDRLSPLRAKDVHFDCRKLDDNDDGMIEVLIGIIPIATLRAYERRLQSIGLAAGRYELAGSDLAFAPVGKTFTSQERFQLWLGVAALTFWIAAILLAPWSRQGELAQVSTELANLRKPAATAAQTRAQLLAAQGTIQAAAEEAARPGALDTMRFLTGLLPDDVQLTNLVIADGDLHLAGSTHDAKKLVTLLNRSHRFHAAHVVGPVVRDMKGRLNFEIDAQTGAGTGRTP